MSQEINVLQRTQVIVVDPITSSVAIISAGPIGPPGVPGPPGSGTGSGGLTPLSISTPITLFTALAPDDDYTWTEIDIDCYASLFLKFTLHSESTTSFAFKITSQPDGAGEEMFRAAGMPSNDYELSWPWWFNNDNTPREKKMYIGIKNTGVVNSTFSITDLRGYALEDD